MTASTTEALRVTGVVLPESEHQDLYVADGRITTSGQPGATDVTAGLGPCWIVPGLVDAHCHVGLDAHGAVDEATQQEQALADRDAGALLLRDCGSPADTRWIDDRDDLPRIIRAGRHLARTRRYIRNYAHEVEPEDLPAYIAREARRSDGWVKFVGDWIERDAGDLTPSFPADAVKAAVEAAHAHGARVTSHVFGEAALPDLIAAGIDCIEHGTGLSAGLVEEMALKRVALVPTVTNLENFPTFAEQGESKFPAYATHMRALFARRYETIGAAYEAGVQIYAGTDAGGSLPHGLIAREVTGLVTYGLSTFDAVGAASWRAREWLGVDATLTEGARADFCVYDADPLVDPGVLAAPRRVVLRGRVVG
ncbi:MAG: amidohydrolase family protein [Nocardioidaceae bacterium]|jgi:imidazolonepropionase-like amidohydrolase|nr:amidohydrolase family protein [Nocardioidaceae bacterium]